MLLSLNKKFFQRRKGVFALADQMVHSGTTFLTGILVGRLLSVGEFGEFSLGLTLVVFSMVLQDNCLATPYTYRFHNNHEKECVKGLRAGAVIQALMLSFLCSALLFVSYAVVSTYSDNGIQNVLWALGLSVPFLFIRETARRLYFTEFKAIEAFIFDVIISSMQIAFILCFWYFEIMSASNVFLAMALASIIGLLGATFILRDEFKISSVNIKKDTIENLNFGKWLLIGSFCHLGSLYTFPWLIYALIGDEKAGAFAACYTLVNLINPFILGFNNYFRPHVMKTYGEEGLESMQKLITRITYYFLPVSVAVACLLFFFGGYLVKLVYGNEFSDLGSIIAVIGISVIPVILNAPVQLATLAINRPQINPKFHSVAFISTICLGIPLVIQWGIVGAAIGYTLSVTAGFIALILLYKRELAKLRA